MRALDDARLAVSLLTAVPQKKSAWPETNRPDVAAWFPAVGYVFGLLSFAIIIAVQVVGVASGRTELLGAMSAPLAVLIVVVWALLGRLLHWDGLADVADGYWGSDDPARRLEIMSDSHVGAFGAAALALTATAQVVAVATVIGGTGMMEMAVYTTPVFARLATTIACWLGRPAKPEGLGAAFIGPPRLRAMVIAAVSVVIAAGLVVWAHGVAGAVWVMVVVMLAFGVPHMFSQRFGGVTGDVMGASVLVVETAALLVAACMAVW